MVHADLLFVAPWAMDLRATGCFSDGNCMILEVWKELGGKNSKIGGIQSVLIQDRSCSKKDPPMARRPCLIHCPRVPRSLSRS